MVHGTDDDDDNNNNNGSRNNKVHGEYSFAIRIQRMVIPKVYLAFGVT